MLEVKGLTKYYGSKCAAEDISFRLEAGQVLGLLGINGAGKSTTMNMIAGYLEPADGRVFVDGINLWEHPVRAKRKIGYLPEKPPLYPDLTVREYLDFMCRLKKVGQDRKRHMEEICELVKISDVGNRLIRNLSKGYGQRVGIAQALLGNPPLVILDEPTVGLDPRQIMEIRDLIRQTGRKQTVILSSHILPDVQAVCDRILVIHQGRLVLDDTIKNMETGRDKSRTFCVSVKAEPEKAVGALYQLQHVERVQLRGYPSQNVPEFAVSVNADYSSHEELFSMILAKGWMIDSVYWEKRGLEDIFLSLTAGRRE